MNDTPRTYEALNIHYSEGGYFGEETTREAYEFARQAYAFAGELERELNEARAVAKYWQEQYGHVNPEHEWEDFPWE